MHLPTTAAILAGGLGTRLRPAVGDRPKPLARVADRPFIAFLLDQLEAAGVRDAILLTGHRAEQMRDELGERHGSMRLRYSREGEPRGTGGAVRLALPMIDAETLLLLNGDSFCDADLDAFARFHVSGQCSLVLARVEDGERFGQVHADEEGTIHGFAEKGTSRGPAWVNAGVYLLPRSLVKMIPPDRSVSLEREVFPRLAREGELRGFRQGAAFIDIGTPESYARAEAFVGAVAAR
jgi:D-glycero-alpha-D-manno-heptose 1-phosphate guanylyltransferase